MSAIVTAAGTIPAPAGFVAPRVRDLSSSAAPRAAPKVVPPHAGREVFGFALASSLSDPTIGYPSWNFDIVSTVAFFGLHVDTAGQLVGDQGWNVWNSSDLTNLVSIAHSHGVKVVLTVVLQDFSANTPDMCLGLNHADTTVAETVTEVRAKGVDGVNIDYEGLDGACGTSDPYWAQHAMTSFAQKMRAGLGPSAYLSIDTYAGAAADGYGFFDVVGLSAYADSFFVMAYDMEYSNYYYAPIYCSRFCLGPTAPLTGYHYNDTDVTSQYLGAVPASKIILGVPYYGRKSCAGGTGPNQIPASSVVADGYLDASGEATYFEVGAGTYSVHRESYSAGSERWDTWYNTTLNCTRELYWDDTVSLGKKYDLVNGSGLRGVGLWTLNYGGGASELWNALSTHFLTCGSASISANVASPQPTGAHITFSSGTTVCATPQWRFWVQPPGGAWKIVQDYSSNRIFNWTDTSTPGTYHIEADVRSSSAVSYDSVASMTVVLSACSGAGVSADHASPQRQGVTILVTGTASCLGTPQYRFWVQPPGGAWAIAADYGASSSYSWNTTGKAVGTYGIEVDARNQGSTTDHETVANTSLALDPPCAKPTLSVSPGSPQAVGTQVVLTSGTADCTHPQWRFWIQPPEGAWTTVRDYSSTPTYTWNTAGKAPGIYNLEVDVRDTSSTASYDGVAKVADVLSVCTDAHLTTDRPAPQAPGMTIVLSGSATCPATPEYRFWVQAPGGSWTIKQDYGSPNTFSWNTSGKPNGTYGLEVDVRDQGSTVTYDTVSNLTFLVDACTAARLSTDKSPPQAPGTSILLTGSAICLGTPQYRFWVQASGGSWTIAQDYGSSNTFTWNTAGKPNGTYGLEVDVRNQGSTVTYDTVSNLNFLVDACTAAHLSTDKSSPQARGTAILLTGSASCQGTPQFRFWVQAPGGPWTVAQDYSSKSTFSWDTTGKPAGPYGLEVDVRNAGSTVSYETVNNLTFTVT